MKPLSHWDEFQWENEIRRHESSVADFFQDLVYCLDLPIGDPPPGAAGTAGTPSDPVAAGKSEAFRQWMRDHDEEEDEENPPDCEPRRPVCFSCVDSLDQLAVMWNQFCVSRCGSELLPAALGISCAFARLLARTADFTEPGKYCDTGLLITLGKRALSDLSDLLFRLDTLREITASDAEEFHFFRLRLALVRDQLTGKLAELR